MDAADTASSHYGRFPGIGGRGAVWVAAEVHLMFAAFVLVALLVPEHEHHVRAVDWFMGDGIINGWSTCALTELGVIQVCAQLPGGVRLPDTTARALLVLTASSPGYVWWPYAVSPVLLQEVRSALPPNR